MSKYSRLKCSYVHGLHLLTTSSIKTSKSFKKGILTFVLYLYPDKKLCPYASKQCMSACLVTSGQGGMNEVVQACRKRRSELWHTARSSFLAMLYADINRAIQYCAKHDLQCAIRLNGTSDILWEKYIAMEQFPTVIFYDYTKIPVKYRKPAFNYHLTFSRSENNWNHCISALEQGINVAVVFRNIPKEYKGYPVISGDDSDMRFQDPQGVIIGLKEKRDTRKKALHSIRKYGEKEFIL